MKYASIILFLASCSAQDEMYEGYDAYIINKGSHYSNRNSSVILNDEVIRSVIFTPSCVYEIDKPEQADINKLFGVSDDISHNQNSARFGWRYYKDSIEVLAYVKNDGKMQFTKLGVANVNEAVFCKLKILSNLYEFNYNGNTTYMKRTSNYTGVRYFLKPYFGGNSVAPQEITIYMK